MLWLLGFLKEHFESERQLLISDLTEKYEILGLGDTPNKA